ncbi:MAG: hypothetical protein A07HB70_01628 [uncultured archaeon A07HB70]|nr:MAG: hypothetical protein A07HB70_01628 [uncultured archaeon A07HB70]
MTAPLAGVVVMIVTGVLRPQELYDSVDWRVIFPLAGVIPLGVALEQSGAAELVGELVAASAAVLPIVGVLWVFYVATALVAPIGYQTNRFVYGPGGYRFSDYLRVGAPLLASSRS